MPLEDTIDNALSAWMKGNGPDADIVISSRMRLARNIDNLPFPHQMGEAEASKVLDGVSLAIEQTSELQQDRLEMNLMKSLNPNERQILVEKHLVSPRHAEPGEFKAVVLSADETISIMVNEEDHLRIQCLLPGLQLQEAWTQVNRVDNLLEASLDLAFCEQRGYLTACPTNVGTGLRASVMMHLPALVMTQQMSRLINAIAQVGLTVRGLYGEGSEAAGNLFQISNQITLGRDEVEIISNLEAVTRQIINQERFAREMLLKKTKDELEDKVCRSYGILRYAKIITSQEAINLLSAVRLGIDLAIIPGVDGIVLNELLILTRNAYLEKLSGTELSTKERDVRRAAIIRARLAMFE